MEIINLDIIPGRTPPVCHASQFDDGRVIRFNLFEGGTAFTLDGSENLTFSVRKPDSNVVTVSVTNTSDSYVDIITTEQMCAVAGASLCELEIAKGSASIGTMNVILSVEKDPLDGGLPSASQINDLASQIAALLADLYDGTAVIFDNIPTAGHVAPTTVTSDGIATALSAKANAADLATVATSGDYNDLSNLPTIPTDLDDLGDVSITSAAAGDVLKYDGNDWVNTPLGIDDLSDVTITSATAGDAIVYDGADWENTALATVATSGSYNDLLDLPTPEAAVNFTLSVNFVGTVGGGTKFYKKNDVVYLNYQGATGTHSTNDTLFTLPAEYRPIGNLNCPFILNNTAYGSISINVTTGVCSINFISSTTANGRIYFNLAYPTV